MVLCSTWFYRYRSSVSQPQIRTRPESSPGQTGEHSLCWFPTCSSYLQWLSRSVVQQNLWDTIRAQSGVYLDVISPIWLKKLLSYCTLSKRSVYTRYTTSVCSFKKCHKIWLDEEAYLQRWMVWAEVYEVVFHFFQTFFQWILHELRFPC